MHSITQCFLRQETALKKCLIAGGVKPHRLGRARFRRLFREWLHDECGLSLEGGRLVRYVVRAQVRITHRGKILLEIARGGRGEALVRHERAGPFEMMLSLKRIDADHDVAVYLEDLFETTGILSRLVPFKKGHVRRTVRESRSYPGIRSVRTVFYYELALTDEEYEMSGHEIKRRGETIYLEWRKDCRRAKQRPHSVRRIA